MDDFLLPKLIYPETTQGAFFAYDETGLFLDKTCFMMISKHARYLQATLSSQLFEFAYKRIFSSVELGQHGFQYNKHALIKLPVKIFNESDSVAYSDEFFYNCYGITNEEIEYITGTIQSPQNQKVAFLLLINYTGRKSLNLLQWLSTLYILSEYLKVVLQKVH